MIPIVGSCRGKLDSETLEVWHLVSKAERSAEMSAVLSSGSRADAVTSMRFMVKRSGLQGQERRQPLVPIVYFY